MNGANRELFAHLARALARYVPEAEREARHNGYVLPAELLAMAEFFADCATVRQGATGQAEPRRTGESDVMRDHPMMTKRETAAALRCSVRSVERLIASGALAAVKVEGSTRIRRSDLDAYIAGLGSPRSFREAVEEKGA